jgi:hypothetical protein
LRSCLFGPILSEIVEKHFLIHFSLTLTLENAMKNASRTSLLLISVALFAAVGAAQAAVRVIPAQAPQSGAVAAPNPSTGVGILPPGIRVAPQPQPVGGPVPPYGKRQPGVGILPPGIVVKH